MVNSWWFLVCLFQGALILITNILTTAIFWRRRSAIKRAAYLLINLALADTLVGLAVISIGIGGIVRGSGFVRDKRETDTFTVMIFFANTSSICSLAAIAVERAFAITKPMRHRTAPTAYYWRGLSLIWITTSLTSTLICVRNLAIPERHVLAIRYVTASIFVVLLLVICLSYCSILWATSRRSPALGQRDLQNRKLAKTLCIVTFFSLATVIPGVTATLLPRVSLSFGASSYVLVIVTFSNSLINPFVYALRMPEFRREFKRLCAGLTVNWPRSREEVIPMADVGARAVTLRSMETLVTSASALHTGICTGAAENKTLEFDS